MGKIKQLFNCHKKIFSRFYQGIRMGRARQYFSIFFYLLDKHARQFVDAFYEQSEAYGSLNSIPLQRLKSSTKGLHSLLPHDERFTFSILIPVIHPHLQSFQHKVKSALDQTSDHFEILLGFVGSSSDPIYKWAEEERKKHPDRIRLVHCEESSKDEQHATILNHLAAEAKGNYLLIAEAEDWMRPDFLFRYEQTLRLIEHPEKTVIHCREMRIDRRQHLSFSDDTGKLDPLVFPYCFTNPLDHSALIPTSLWKKCQGLRAEYSEEAFYDLILRLNLAGADFLFIPLPLYASHQRKKVHTSSEWGIKALKEYVKAKKLNWTIEKGMIEGTYRAIPPLFTVPQIQVIIPFKDQKELTLKAVHAVLKQKGVKPFITAVDNNSQDHSIGEELEKLGVELLRIHEPFNFSRLNNLAVRQTKHAKQCELLLFLNNDVEIHTDALLEMSRWVDQPHVGMVGCRLHYPSGSLQHGGIICSRSGPREEMIWMHTDMKKSKEELKRGGTIHVSDAVTAACAMMKRQIFEEVGGFDEVFYPIAHSDTNLATKLKANGWICLYTPYAEGIHHESQTRQTHNLEDFEKSTWLHEFYVNVK